MLAVFYIFCSNSLRNGLEILYQYYVNSMQLDNANPIVFQPAQESFRVGNGHDFTLWAKEDNELVSSNDLVADDSVEPIDEQEIFGTVKSTPIDMSVLMDTSRSYSIHIRS